ncbi:MAG: hypothetical protein WC942_11460 [Clostridia bacterium]|jgi:hypothetical protein
MKTYKLDVNDANVYVWKEENYWKWDVCSLGSRNSFDFGICSTEKRAKEEAKDHYNFMNNFKKNYKKPKRVKWIKVS